MYTASGGEKYYVEKTEWKRAQEELGWGDYSLYRVVTCAEEGREVMGSV